MSLRLKLLTSLLVGGLMVCAAVVWGAHEAALQQLRQDLVERAHLLATTINEATQTTADDDAIRVAVEDITRKVSGLRGITVATKDPFTLWASSFATESLADPATKLMLSMAMKSSDRGVFGYFFEDNGDLILVEPLWERQQQDGEFPKNQMHRPHDYQSHDGRPHSSRFVPESTIKVSPEAYRGVVYIHFDWESIRKIAGNILWEASMIALVGLAAMLLLSFILLQQFVIKPLRIIQQGVEKQAAGEHGFRVPDLGHDEFGQLGDNFNQMLESLVKRDNRLKAIIDHIPIAMTLRDQNGDTVMSNRRSREWMQNEPFAFGNDGPHSDWIERVRDGEQFSWDHAESTREGDVRHFSTVAFPVMSEHDQAIEFGTASSDITARKALEEELVQAKNEAESANKAKSRFLSSMSHELRTPLNAIIGFTELMRMGVDEDEAQSYLDQMDRAGRHLLALVGEVLDLAQVESGKLRLNMESVKVADVIRECMELAQPIARDKGIPLIESDAQPDLAVMADFVRLKQALLNLISNAIKYNRDGGQVVISTHRCGEFDICLQVEDTGPGIPRELQAKLFQPFERLGAANSSIEGTGIGLVFSRRIVELMNGGLHFESVEGKGSRFWIELPLLAGQELADTAGFLDSDDADNPGRHSTGGKTVLCIEDNPASLQLVESLLSKFTDCQILKAMEANTGLQLADSHAPDLILLDINLPGINGYELLKTIRDNPRLRNIPVVAISSGAMPQDIRRGLEAGFDDYLPKPLVSGDFLNMLKSRLDLSD